MGTKSDDGTADAKRAFAGGSGGSGMLGGTLDDLKCGVLADLRLGGGNGGRLGDAASCDRLDELVPGLLKAGSGR